MGADKALRMLRTLRESFRGEPSVFLNRAQRDGHAPLDVAVRFFNGELRVVRTLAAQGARFLPRHLSDARAHGHEALAAWLVGLATPPPPPKPS